MPPVPSWVSQKTAASRQTRLNLVIVTPKKKYIRATGICYGAHTASTTVQGARSFSFAFGSTMDILYCALTPSPHFTLIGHQAPLAGAVSPFNFSVRFM